MMNCRKFRKNVKAISPVISVLLMIAVAVAASLVAYAWVMGYMGFTTNKVGKAVAIQSIAQNGHVYVQNVGESTLTLEAVYVDGLAPTNPSIPTDALKPGDTGEIVTGMNFANGQKVTIKVTTVEGAFAELTKIFP
jgi:flagellin-like protein